MICDGCVYSECVINEDPCEGVSCNDCETCESGTCVWTGCDLCSGIDCDDGDACTTNSCNSWDGSCSSEPVNCDDGNPCTTDFCDSTDGCHNDVNENDPVCTSECTTDAECNDEDDCTTDLCESGTCQNYYIDDCGAVWGCTDSTARNYNPEATDDDGSCDYSYCGDGAKNGDEQCDGSDFGVEDCETQGHFGGTLNCNYDCTYDESKCFDGECDPNATPYEDCTTLDSERYSEGKAYCNDNGQGQYVWDTSQCVAKSKCTDQSGTEYNEGDPADCRKVNYYYACGTATCGSNGQWNIDSCKTNQAGECPTGYTWMSLGDGCDSGTCKPSALKYCPDGSRRTVCSGTKLGEFAGITISAPGTAGKDYSSDVEGMPGPDYIKGVAAMGLQTKDTLNNLNIDVPWLKFNAGPVKIALTGSFSRDVGPAGANVNLNGGVNRGFSLPAIGDSVHGMSYTPTATIRGNAVTLQASWGF